MSDKIHIRKGKRRDVLALRGKLRESDKEELRAATGEDPDAVMLESWDISTFTWTMFYGRSPIAVFGVAPVGGEDMIGTPWLVGSDMMAVPEVREFMKVNSKRYIRLMSRCFPLLVNFVYHKNKTSIKWLKWCGFTVHTETTPHGPLNQPFYGFYMERNHV